MMYGVRQHRLPKVLISQAVGWGQRPCCTAQGAGLTIHHLSDTPAPFLDGLPSPLAADTTHPEGHASSAHRHSPQGQGNPGHPTTITRSTDNSTKTLRLEDSQLLQRPSTSSDLFGEEEEF